MFARSVAVAVLLCLCQLCCPTKADCKDIHSGVYSVFRGCDSMYIRSGYLRVSLQIAGLMNTTATVMATSVFRITKCVTERTTVTTETTKTIAVSIIYIWWPSK